MCKHHFYVNIKKKFEFYQKVFIVALNLRAEDLLSGKGQIQGVVGMALDGAKNLPRKDK